MVNPTPTIAIGGQFMSCATATDEDGRKVFPLNGSTLVGDMTIEWGRSDMWTQPQPSVLTFTIWEAEPNWLRRIAAQTQMRLATAVLYTREGNTNPGDRYIFQGFTTNVDVKASRQRTPVGMVDGWMVRIQAADRTAFLGNVPWNPMELPEEQMIQRAVRIRNQAAGVGIRQFYFEDHFKTGQVKPLDVKGKTVLDTVNGMYSSFADQYYYEPNRNVVNRIPTGGAYAYVYMMMGVSTDKSVVRLYPFDFPETSGKEDPIDQIPYKGATMGACDLTAELALSSSMIQSITTISCKWYDKPNGYREWTTNVKVKDVVPEALLQFESWYNDGTIIDPIIEDVKRLVTGDAAQPMHPRVRWDTSKTGDIIGWRTFESLTLPAQTLRFITLTGDPFAVALNMMPTWQPSGGTITYGRGKWDITVDLAPSGLKVAPDHSPVTADTIDRTITLGGDNPRHLDPSISSYDMYFVSTRYPNLYAMN